MKKISIGCFLVWTTSFAHSQLQLDFKNTYVVIAGVLQWESKSLSSFSDKNRKDKELYDQLIAMGVKKSNITLLLDSQATLEAMRNAVLQQVKKCGTTGNFIFYYAGHGTKLENGTTYFLNYDIYKDGTTGFDVNFLSETINKFFQGENIFLLADCCYSGSLLGEGDKIGKTGKSIYVLSSATSSNISTGNWTFTQTFLDCLRGNFLADYDGNKNITYAEVAKEMKQAMKYRERQLNSFGMKNGNLNLVISVSKQPKQDKINTKGVGPFALGSYVAAWNKSQSRWEPARIIALADGQYTCEFYHYSDKEQVVLPKDKLRSYYFINYPLDTAIEVEWQGKYYPATITKSDNDFYYIHYTGYENYWDEWVLYDRIRSKTEKRAEVNYEGTFYPARILEYKDKKYFVHYDGYDFSSDEWVDEHNVKLL